LIMVFIRLITSSVLGNKEQEFVLCQDPAASGRGVENFLRFFSREQ